MGKNWLQRRLYCPARAAAKKIICRLEKFFKKYLKNILKSVDFLKEIWYNIRVERLRGEPRSHSDLPTEERERIDYCVHNNPPKILHPLNLISPSLKINHSALQERLRFVLCLVGSYLLYSFKNSRSKDRLFFLLYKRTDAQPFLSMLQGRRSNHFVATWRINPRIISPRVSYYLYSATLGFDALECYYVL